MKESGVSLFEALISLFIISIVTGSLSFSAIHIRERLTLRSELAKLDRAVSYALILASYSDAPPEIEIRESGFSLTSSEKMLIQETFRSRLRSNRERILFRRGSWVSPARLTAKLGDLECEYKISLRGKSSTSC